MASTGYQNGTDIALFVNGTAIAFMTSTDLEINMETRDASNKDSAGWKEVREGQRNWTASGEAIFAEDATYGYAELYALVVARTQVEAIVTTSVVGDNEYTGQVYVTALSKSTPNEDTVTYSITLEGTGALVESVAT